MKKTLFLIILTFIFADIHAQMKVKARFKVSYSDGSNNGLFVQHPDLNHIQISYRSDTAYTVRLTYKTKTSALIDESYYLAFEGDRYMLPKKYPNLVLPATAKLDIQCFEGIKDSIHSDYSLVTTLRRDTVDNLFSYYTFPGDIKYPEPSPRHRARLKGNSSLLQQKLTQSFKLWKPVKVLDSTLVMTGIVERDGTLGRLELISNAPSQFSNKTIEFIAQEAKTWTPAEQNDRTVKYLVKFLFV